MSAPPRAALLALQAVEFQEARHGGEADGDALGGQRGVEAAGADVRVLLQDAEDPRALRCYERRAAAGRVRADIAARPETPELAEDAGRGDVELPCCGANGHPFVEHRRHRPAPQVLADRLAFPRASQPACRNFRHLPFRPHPARLPFQV